MEEKKEGIRTIIGGDFNARIGEEEGEIKREDEDGEEGKRKSNDKYCI